MNSDYIENSQNGQNNTERLPIIRPQNWVFIQNWVKKMVKKNFGLEIFLPVDKSFLRTFLVLYTEDKLAKVEIEIDYGFADVTIYSNNNVYGAKLVEIEGRLHWKKLDLTKNYVEPIASKIERFLNLRFKLEADQNYLKLKGLLEMGYNISFKNFDSNPTQVQIAAIKEAVLAVENAVSKDREIVNLVNELCETYIY